MIILLRYDLNSYKCKDISIYKDKRYYFIILFLHIGQSEKLSLILYYYILLYII